MQDVLRLVKNECDELDETLLVEGKRLRHLQRALQDKDADINQLRSQLKYSARSTLMSLQPSRRKFKT